MTASNLAICFAPSLFHVYGLRSGSSSTPAASNGTASTALGRASPRRDGKHASSAGSGLPDETELIEQKAALDCLTFMIVNVNELFTVNVSLFPVVQLIPGQQHGQQKPDWFFEQLTLLKQ